MIRKPNVTLYFDDLRGVFRLSDAQRGKLFSAILRFSEFGEQPCFDDPVLEYAWDTLMPKLLLDDCSYWEGALKKRYATYCRDAEKDGHTKLSFEEWKCHVGADKLLLSAIIADASPTTGDHQRLSATANDQPYSYSLSSPSSQSSSDSLAVGDAAAALLREYGIAESVPMIRAVREDLEKHGRERVAEALKRSAESDKMGGVSVKFYRLKLNDIVSGKQPPHRLPAAQTGYQARTYSPSDFSSLEVDLDSCDEDGFLPGERDGEDGRR